MSPKIKKEVNIMRKTFSLILSVIMVLSLFTVGAFAAEGTAINSAEDFKNMTADGTYYLAADITVSETYAGTFTGTLDGNGKTVTVSAPMFEQMNGTVKNLTTAGKLEYNAAAADEKVYFGAVAKQATAGVFEKVTNKATITVSGAAKEVCVGGICGRAMKGGATATKFVGCTNEAAISSIEATGGICGESQVSEDATLFDGCYNKGNITSSGTVSGVAAGGIVGYSGTAAITIKNCTNDGSITSGYRAGGIQGDARKAATISSCTNNGTVKAVECAGGIVAYSGDKGIKTGLSVTECVNNGDVSGSTKVAGIAGYAWASEAYGASVIKCINNGNITLGETKKADGTLDQGYASEFLAYANSTTSIIKDCIGVGKLTATGDTTNSHLAIISMSSADVTKYTIENLFIADQGTTTHLSWTATEANAASIIELSAALGKNLEGSETVKAITRGELNADFVAKANAAIGAGTFALSGNKVAFASSVPSGGGSTPTGDVAAYVAVAAVAAVVILSAALVSKKRRIAE